MTRGVLLALFSSFFSQIGGRPGLATLVLAVGVGLFVQNWDRALDLGLELVGVRLDGAPSSNGRRKYWMDCGAGRLPWLLLTPSLAMPSRPSLCVKLDSSVSYWPLWHKQGSSISRPHVRGTRFRFMDRGGLDDDLTWFDH